MNKFNIENEELDLVIWRYMDLSKFIDFMGNSNLFLPSIDSFEDKFEGVHNSIGKNDFFDITNEGKIIRINKATNDRQRGLSDDLKKTLVLFTNQIRKAVGVSCWRLSNHESHAMWKVYLSSNEGVAIKTKISTLVNNIDLSDDKLKIGIGKVKYIDYSSEKIPIDYVFNPIFYKNNYFEHEKELRLIAYKIADINKELHLPENFSPLENKGIKVNVDYKSVIEEVVVSPYAPEWFYKLIKKISNEKYNLDVPITWSLIELN